MLLQGSADGAVRFFDDAGEVRRWHGWCLESWSLTSLQQRLVKTGGRLVKHARYYWLMLAEGHLTRARFAAMMRRIALLPLPAN